MDDETGLSRWSRLKRAKTKPVAEEPAEASAPVASTAAVPAATPAVGEAEEAEEAEGESPAAVAPEDLPDPDTLDKDSDFSVFLGENVPAELRRRAMSVLWRSDPVLANLDGLNDYDEDFSILQKVGEVVKTAYQVGKGYADEVADEVPEDGAEQTAEHAETPTADDTAAADSEPRPEPTDEPTDEPIDEPDEDGDLSV